MKRKIDKNKIEVIYDMRIDDINLFLRPLALFSKKPEVGDPHLIIFTKKGTFKTHISWGEEANCFSNLEEETFIGNGCSFYEAIKQIGYFKKEEKRKKTFELYLHSLCLTSYDGITVDYDDNLSSIKPSEYMKNENFKMLKKIYTRDIETIYNIKKEFNIKEKEIYKIIDKVLESSHSYILSPINEVSSYEKKIKRQTVAYQSLDFRGLVEPSSKVIIPESYTEGDSVMSTKLSKILGKEEETLDIVVSYISEQYRRKKEATEKSIV